MRAVSDLTGDYVAPQTGNDSDASRDPSHLQTPQHRATITAALQARPANDSRSGDGDGWTAPERHMMEFETPQFLALGAAARTPDSAATTDLSGDFSRMHSALDGALPTGPLHNDGRGANDDDDEESDGGSPFHGNYRTNPRGDARARDGRKGRNTADAGAPVVVTRGGVDGVVVRRSNAADDRSGGHDASPPYKAEDNSRPTTALNSMSPRYTRPSAVHATSLGGRVRETFAAVFGGGAAKHSGGSKYGSVNGNGVAMSPNGTPLPGFTVRRRAAVRTYTICLRQWRIVILGVWTVLLLLGAAFFIRFLNSTSSYSATPSGTPAAIADALGRKYFPQSAQTNTLSVFLQIDRASLLEQAASDGGDGEPLPAEWANIPIHEVPSVRAFVNEVVVRTFAFGDWNFKVADFAVGNTQKCRSDVSLVVNMTGNNSSAPGSGSILPHADYDAGIAWVLEHDLVTNFSKLPGLVAASPVKQIAVDASFPLLPPDAAASAPHGQLTAAEAAADTLYEAAMLVNGFMASGPLVQATSYFMLEAAGATLLSQRLLNGAPENATAMLLPITVHCVADTHNSQNFADFMDTQVRALASWGSKAAGPLASPTSVPLPPVSSSGLPLSPPTQADAFFLRNVALNAQLLGPRLSPNATAEQISSYAAKLTQALSADMTGVGLIMHPIVVQAKRDLEHTDTIVIPIAFMIMATVLGSARWLLLPLLTVAATISLAFTSMYLVTFAMPVNTSAPSLMLTLSLAMGIDYNLFLLSRYREEVRRGADPRLRAVLRTLATAGHTVLVSGVTLVASFVALIFFKENFLKSMGIGCVAAIVVALAFSLTCTPALLLQFPFFFARGALYIPAPAWLPMALRRTALGFVPPAEVDEFSHCEVGPDWLVTGAQANNAAAEATGLLSGNDDGNSTADGGNATRFSSAGPRRLFGGLLNGNAEPRDDDDDDVPSTAASFAAPGSASFAAHQRRETASRLDGRGGTIDFFTRISAARLASKHKDSKQPNSVRDISHNDRDDEAVGGTRTSAFQSIVQHFSSLRNLGRVNGSEAASSASVAEASLHRLDGATPAAKLAKRRRSDRGYSPNSSDTSSDEYEKRSSSSSGSDTDAGPSPTREAKRYSRARAAAAAAAVAAAARSHERLPFAQRSSNKLAPLQRYRCNTIQEITAASHDSHPAQSLFGRLRHVLKFPWNVTIVAGLSGLTAFMIYWTISHAKLTNAFGDFLSRGSTERASYLALQQTFGGGALLPYEALVVLNGPPGSAAAAAGSLSPSSLSLGGPAAVTIPNLTSILDPRALAISRYIVEQVAQESATAYEAFYGFCTVAGAPVYDSNISACLDRNAPGWPLFCDPNVAAVTSAGFVAYPPNWNYTASVSASEAFHTDEAVLGSEGHSVRMVDSANKVKQSMRHRLGASTFALAAAAADHRKLVQVLGAMASPLYYDNTHLLNAPDAAVAEGTASTTREPRAAQLTFFAPVDPAGPQVLPYYESLLRGASRRPQSVADLSDPTDRAAFLSLCPDHHSGTTTAAAPSGAPSAASCPAAEAALATASAQLQLEILGFGADSGDTIRDAYGHLPYIALGSIVCILATVGFSFRSVVVPLRCVLSIAFTQAFVFGMSVLVFEQGALAWTGMHMFSGPTSNNFSHGISWLDPLIVFCVLVGVALDYDIFLLTRVQEFVIEDGMSTRVATLYALCATGKIITAAGVIMAVAFCGLMLSSIQLLNELGFMLVSAALFDTFVVRTLLVPALLSLLGRWHWFPSGIDTQK